MNKNLQYYKDNAEEDYLTTPISVLRYITELESEIEFLKQCRRYDATGNLCDRPEGYRVEDSHTAKRIDELNK